MSPPRSGPPALLVSLESTDTGRSLEPRDALARASAALGGVPGVALVRPSTASREVLERMPPGVSLAAVLPDMARLAREVADRGAITAALGRLRRGGLGSSLRLADTVLRNFPAVARQDFRGIVLVLMALDRAGLGAAALQAVVLAAPLTDLLLAAGHGACLAHVVRFVRRRMGAQAGLETLNLGHLLPRLDAWGVAPDFVIGPLNPRGFRMKPSAASVVAALRGSPTPVVASEVTAGGTVPLAAGLDHARSVGAAGVVVTLDDLAPAR